jgi:hypothetical protein
MAAIPKSRSFDLQIELRRRAVYTSVDGRLVQLNPDEVELLLGLLAVRRREVRRPAHRRRIDPPAAVPARRRHAI